MKSRVLIPIALVAVAILGFLALFLRSDRGEAPGVAPPIEAAEAPQAKPKADLQAAAPDARKEVVAEPEPDAEVPGADAPTAQEVASSEAPPPEKPDLEAKTSIQIRTLDPDGLPIEGVTVSIWAMRSQREPGSHYLYRGEAPSAVTDHRGIATLDHWVWVDLDGKTGKVTLSATHEQFTPFQGDVEIGPGVRDIELQWGATVVVSGWYGERSRKVEDIEVQVDRDAGLPATAWKELADGSLRTNRLGVGAHRVRIRHESEALGRLYSAVRDFELAAGDWLELDLELVPGARFEGVLENRVPRPVLDGHVQVCVQGDGPRGSSPSLYREFETDIRPDGSFAFEALPPGNVQLTALCQGWVSDEIDYEETPLTVPPWVTPCVVAMRQTGTVEIEVLDEAGNPLAGARAGASPNVYYEGVGSTIFPWREWEAGTDEAGLAVLTDLPPEDSLWIHAYSDTHQMRKEDRERTPSVEVRPGDTTRITLRLEKKD